MNNLQSYLIKGANVFSDRHAYKCPNCIRGYVYNALCYDYNPVFSCYYASERVNHVHCYCQQCKASWIVFRSPKPVYY